MHGHGRPLFICELFLLSTLLTSVAGCAGFRTNRPDRAMVPATSHTDRLSATPPQLPTDDRQRETLAAVEDFLARTEQYRLTADDVSTTQTGDTMQINEQIAHYPVTTAPPKDQKSVGLSSANDPVHVRTPVDKREQAIANTQIALTDGSQTGRTLAVPVVRSVTVRVREPAPTPSEDSPEKNTTNTPLEVTSDDNIVSIDRFIDFLKRSAEKNTDIASAWQLRLVQVALGYEPDGFEERSVFSADTAKLLSALMRVVETVRSLAQDPLSTGEDTLNRVSALEEMVAERADPIVESIALCRRVVTFGVYDEMDDNEFVAGHAIATIVYSEIRNFQSEVISDGMHRTVFATRLEVLTADGQSVWQHEEPEIIDRCRRRRRDFFIAQRITIPATLSSGDYVLKVMVEDKLSGKAGEATRVFTVSATDMRTAGR